MMKKMMCLAFSLLLILSLMHVGAAEESFLYRNTFSFGMSREEVEAAAETLYPAEDGWHKSTNSYVIDEAHETINYDSSVNGSEVAFAFSTQNGVSELEEIMLVIVDLKYQASSAAQPVSSGDASDGATTESTARVRDNSQADYEAVENTLTAKYGAPEEAESVISQMLEPLLTYQGISMSQLVRRVIWQGENRIIVDHAIVFGRTGIGMNMVAYRYFTPEAYEAYEQQAVESTPEDYLNDIL